MMEVNAHATKIPCEQQVISPNQNTDCAPIRMPDQETLSDLSEHAGKRVLLHACCGPCSMEPVRLLKERGLTPTIHFANANISPACEYERRLDTLREFAATEGVSVVEGNYDPEAWERTVGRIGDAAKLKHGVIADEHAAEFAAEKAAARNESTASDIQQTVTTRTQAIHTFETDPLDRIPSVGNTSEEARLARAARCRACYRVRFREAAEYAAANGFPLLGTTLSVSPYQHTRIIKEELQRAADRAGIDALFEDYRPYYDNATERSKEAHMYRQNYCGCRFSDKEATAERVARKAERKLIRIAEKLNAAKERAASFAGFYVDPAHPGDAFEADPIPHAEDVRISLADDGSDGSHVCSFKAFDTSVELIAYGPSGDALHAFQRAQRDCRDYERRLSVWLPHSDIARLNASKGEPCPIHEDTAKLLSLSLEYCAKSNGVFDITMEPVIRLWDFHAESIPNPNNARKALEHVDWRKANVFLSGDQWFAHLADSLMGVNLGGTAKGWVADRLADAMQQESPALVTLSVNLGGNVLVRGKKPSGDPWYVGIRDPQDPHNPNASLGTIPLENASAVTSGTYERCFTGSDGATYHHVLSTQDGLPVRTDLVSATVIAERSSDAEGYSTTLLALGLDRALDFVRNEPTIITAILVEADGTMHQA